MNNKNTKTKSIINSILETGDIIIMKDEKKATPPHAGIVYKTDKGNNIGVLITRIKSTDAATHLFKNDWVADIYRYNPSNKDMINIPDLIGQQAFNWYNIGQNQGQNKNSKKLLFIALSLIIFFISTVLFLFDQNSRFMVMLVMCLLNCGVMICYHYFWSNEETKIGYNYKAFYEDLFCAKNGINTDTLYDHNDDLNALNYIKYSLRKYVSVSLKRGVTCYGFVMMCIASALLDDLLSPYHLHKDDESWPSLKYNNECCKKHAPSIYQNSIKIMQNQQKHITYNRQHFVELLMENYLDEEIRNDPKEIRKWQGYVKKERQALNPIFVAMFAIFGAIFGQYLFDQTGVTVFMCLVAVDVMILYYISGKKKKAMSCYFAHHDERVDDEKVFYEKAKQKLGGLISMHPKYSNINHLVTYFNENNDVWHRIQTNVQ